ncbi:MAG: fumarylacetoacetate hydrolase family protein [Alphaproteobacteria bacterium]|nr:fumarylacetoacetate hydrolase family protein [Alphaproteobacteria bacterium]
MKLVSYTANGKDAYGVVAGDGIVDLSARIGERYPDIKALLAGDALAAAAAAADGQSADEALDAVTYRPVIVNPDKVICVGLNYKAHREETGRAPTDNPALFIRFADTQCGHNQPMIKPTASDSFDYEGELAVIIGKPGRHVKAADWASIVAGYAIYNDGSVRDWQNHTIQWTAGKNFPATGAFGPWMVTADELGDPTQLELTTRLNGNVMQNTTTDLMIFDIPTLIEYITTFTQLRPGDVISTGTPGGVGFKRDPQVFMKPGDTVEVEISKIGTLTNPIAAE